MAKTISGPLMDMGEKMLEMMKGLTYGQGKDVLKYVRERYQLSADGMKPEYETCLQVSLNFSEADENNGTDEDLRINPNRRVDPETGEVYSPADEAVYSSGDEYEF